MDTTIVNTLKSNRDPLTVKSLAKVLGVSGRSVYRLVEGERIPYFRIEASIRFDPVAVSKWLEEKMVA